MDAMRTMNVFNARFGQAEEAHLAFTPEIADGPGDILHRHVPVYPMLVEQIDVIDAEPEKRCVGDLTDVFGPTIGSAGRAARMVHTKFRRDNGVVPAPSERPTEEFLVDIRAVYLRSVEEVDSEIKCAVDRGHRLRLIRRFAVILAHSHAAEAESRNYQAAISKFALLHCFSLGTVSPLSKLE